MKYAKKRARPMRTDRCEHRDKTACYRVHEDHSKTLTGYVCQRCDSWFEVEETLDQRTGDKK